MQWYWRATCHDHHNDKDEVSEEAMHTGQMVGSVLCLSAAVIKSMPVMLILSQTCYEKHWSRYYRVLTQRSVRQQASVVLLQSDYRKCKTANLWIIQAWRKTQGNFATVSNDTRGSSIAPIYLVSQRNYNFVSIQWRGYHLRLSWAYMLSAATATLVWM